MKKIANSQQGGLVLTVVVVAVLMILGYVVINSFLSSDEGQEIQQTINSTRDSAGETVDSATETIDSANQLIEKVR